MLTARNRIHALFARTHAPICKRLRELEEAAELAAKLAEAFPDPQRSLFGIAELITNGIEHGNCGIGYTEKGNLLRSGQWHHEVARRLALPENAEKWLHVELLQRGDGIGIYVRDEGNGFRWQPYLEIDPHRVEDLNGRGIALARHVAFDALHYSKRGNEVWAFCRAR